MYGKIVAIEKGWGEKSTYFSTDKEVNAIHFVDEIKEELKDAGNGLLKVYRGYLKGKLFFEIGASIDITLIYER